MFNVIPVALGLLASQVAAQDAAAGEIHYSLVTVEDFHWTEAEQARWKDSFKPGGPAFYNPTGTPVINLSPGQNVVIGDSTSEPDRGIPIINVTLFSETRCEPDKQLNTLHFLQCGILCVDAQSGNSGLSALVSREDSQDETLNVFHWFEKERCQGAPANADDDNLSALTACTSAQTEQGFASFLVNTCHP